MDTTPATASRAVDRLEDLRLVSRSNDASDGRAVLVSATRSGQTWLERRRSLILEVLRGLPEASVSPTVIADVGRLNAALREATGHDEVARGALLAP
jgi:DNA-binding MarR family transcriptional regulator